jgi:hypothetical protein
MTGKPELPQETSDLLILSGFMRSKRTLRLMPATTE